MSQHTKRQALARGTAAVLTGAALLAAAASPAFASGKPAVRPTSITIHAMKSTAPPKHKDSFVATLKSGKKRLANEQLCLADRTKTSSGWSKWSTCTNFASLTDAKGQATVTGVVPGNKKGTKTQYEVEFAGVSGSYKPSHSRVITVRTS